MVPVHLQVDFPFPRSYEVRIFDAPLPVHPAEPLHHYPAEIPEGDRDGIYLRVQPHGGRAWRGFFALGFDSAHAVHGLRSCPDPDSLCAVAGGYAYVVKASDARQWFRVEQMPVVHLYPLPDSGLLLFAGFTGITALGRDGVRWTTGRLSWEGLSGIEIRGDILRGQGWDALSDREVPFEVDLITGRHTGGAAPGAIAKPFIP